MRKCKICLETKPLVDFVKTKKCKDGYRYKCKACHQADIKLPRLIPKRECRLVAPSGMKFCTRCKTTKQASEFYVNNASPDKLGSKCKDCSKAVVKGQWRLTKYKLSDNTYSDMQHAQNSSCGICKQSNVPLFIDHNHTTGRVRMLLCRHCNSMIGFAKENPTTLIAGAAYIEKFNIP